MDSDKGMNEFLPIHNLINEFYSRDISKKIRSTVRQKGNSGQAVTSALPYGYIRNPQDKNEWIIDEYAGEIVRRIFDYYVNQMMSANEIAKILTSEKHLVPRVYRRARKGIEVDKTAYQWSVSTITQMLKHQEYVGDTVNFRYEITSYKNKKIICNGDDKIKIFPDTHPAIVSRELYQMAQDRRFAILQDLISIFSRIFFTARTVTQDYTADIVAEKRLFSVMNVQCTEKKKAVIFTVFPRNFSKERFSRRYRECYSLQSPILMISTI